MRNPKLDSLLQAVADETLAAAVFGPGDGTAGAEAGARMDRGRVQVEIAVRPENADRAVRAVEGVGGEVTGRGFGDTALQAWLAPESLEAVAADTSVLYVRRPVEARPLESIAAGSVDSEGLDAMNAAAWHAAGMRGGGIRVGIIDGGFLGYRPLASSELSRVVAARSFVDGIGSNDVEGDDAHGTACAEIVQDVAPDAELFLARVNTPIDFEEALQWLRDDEGVDVISTSISYFNEGPGDGTGRLPDLVATSRAAGVLWATSAGNYRESHWGGPFVDRDKDGFHDFILDGFVNCVGPEGECFIGRAGEEITAFLRWSDWAAVDQDLDLYVVRWNGLFWENAGFGGDSSQSGQPGQTPVEVVSGVTYGSATRYGLAVERFSGSRAVDFDVTLPGLALRQQVGARSLSSPADADAAVTVAALDVDPPYPQEPYSSEGPTNGPGGQAAGGRRKPDIAAFANVSTVAAGAHGFNGTSAATPHVAGATALVRGLYPEWTVDQVEQFLLGRAVDMGPSGADNRFGSGRLYLGAPPAPPTPTRTATALRTSTPQPTTTSTVTPSAPPPSATRTLTASRRPTDLPTPIFTLTQTPARTATRSVTASTTPTPTHSRTPPATPTSGPCYGDCNVDGRLSIDEVLTMVNQALGALPLDRCASADADGDGAVEIDEVLRAINATLFGCVAAATATPTLAAPSPTAPSTAGTPPPPSTTATVGPSLPRDNTRTATQTRTRTATATPTGSGVSTSEARISIGNAVGVPGSQVTIAVSLDPRDHAVAFTRNDIQLEDLSPVRIARIPGGGANCAVNPGLGAGVTGLFQCLFISGDDCRRVRAVISRSNGPLLPGGLLYTCTAVINANASQGRYPVVALAVDARDASNQQVAAIGNDGAVDVVSEIPPSPTPSVTRTPSPPLAVTPTVVPSSMKRVYWVAPGELLGTAEETGTGMFTSGLTGTNAANSFSPGPINLRLGMPDESGIASLTLSSDAYIEISIVDGSRLCFAMKTEGSEGSIDCDGGTAYDTVSFQPGGDVGFPFSVTTGLGQPAGPGNGELLVQVDYQLVAAGDTAPCTEIIYTNPRQIFPFTTTNATSQKGEGGSKLMLTVSGEPFDCANFATPGTGGRLAAGHSTGRPPAGDVSNVFRFAEVN